MSDADNRVVLTADPAVQGVEVRVPAGMAQPGYVHVVWDGDDYLCVLPVAEVRWVRS